MKSCGEAAGSVVQMRLRSCTGRGKPANHVGGDKTWNNTVNLRFVESPHLMDLGAGF